MAEDPGYRRINGGTNNQFILHIIPMAQPQILSTAAGPAILHSSDFSPITAANPAVAGEALSVFATGLGPTNPDLDLSLPFPSKPLAAVNSPMSVTANGTDAEILGAVGYPGAVNGYQVNFRLPPGMGKGLAAIQLTAAWIPSTPASVAVQ
jgi:uncharacterized protein (TIGR03437 family)